MTKELTIDERIVIQQISDYLVHEFTNCLEHKENLEKRKRIVTRTLVLKAGINKNLTLKLVREANERAITYWDTYGKVHPIGIGRETKFLDLMVEYIDSKRSILPTFLKESLDETAVVSELRD